MESNNKDGVQKQNLHNILAHSHTMQFILFLLGVLLDSIFKIRIFTSSPLIVDFGVVLLMLGSVLIFWAQYTSHHLPEEDITKESFSRGPYRYIKNPTNFGIFFMILGFGIISNSFFVILFGFISSLIAKFVFLDKEKEILISKYGAPYLEYRKSVKF